VRKRSKLSGQAADRADRIELNPVPPRPWQSMVLCPALDGCGS
jgi:hypothetical protein